MRYQKTFKGDRLIVTDEGAFPMDSKVTSNLLKHEIMVTILEAFDCPIGNNCINLEDGPKDKITSICKFLGPYPVMKGKKHLSEIIQCRHDGEVVEKYTKRLYGKECCGYYDRCAYCDPPEEVVLPDDDSPKKSNAFIYCRPLKE